MLTLRSTGSDAGKIELYLQKPSVPEQEIGWAKGQSGQFDGVSILLQPLEAGDQLFLRYDDDGDGEVQTYQTYFQVAFLYEPD